ncbi:MAG: hypothetical protein ACLFWD_00265 [Anaerolineales bacterium]
MEELIGRVTRCSTRGFVGAMRLPEPEVPAFGGFCLAEAQQGQSQVVGLIYDLSVGDDEFARQIASSETATAEQIADHQENRLVPVEFSALSVGYRRENGFIHSLPPQPPLPLAPITVMPPSDLETFTSDFGFLQLVLGASQLPIDDLLASALANAAAVRTEVQQRRYLVEAGRQASLLLGQDLVRLDNLLSRLRQFSHQ